MIKKFDDFLNEKIKEVEKVVKKWEKGDKYPCPNCGKQLSEPDYKCTDCNIKLKVKMNFSKK